MTLLAPAALWLLAAIPVLLLLHMRRRRTVEVPSLHVWRRVSMSDAAPPRRPPRSANLPLWMQLAAIALLALALARPSIVETRPPGHLIVVLDVSLLLDHDEEGEPRLAEAVRGVRALIRGATAADEPVSLITAEPVPRVLVTRTRDRALLDRALDAVETVDALPSWSAVLRVVDALASDGERTDVAWVVARESAALAASIVAAEALPDRHGMIVIGNEPIEPGLVRFAARAQGNAVRFEADVVRLDAETAYDAELWFRPRGLDAFTRLDTARVAFMPNRHGVVAFTTPVLGTGVAEIRLVGGPERLLASSQAVVLSDRRTIRVLHVGRANPALEAAFSAMDNVALDVSESLPADAHRYHLVVVDRTDVPRHPGTDTLWIGVTPPFGFVGSDWIENEELDRGGWSRDHALAVGVDFSDVTAFRARQLPYLAGAEVLLEGAGFPLVQTRITEHGHETVIAFSLIESDWTEQASFPIFVANALRMSVPLWDSGVAPSCVAGGRCELGALRSRVEAVRAPDGALLDVVPPVQDVGDDGIAVITSTSFAGYVVPTRAGLHRLEYEGGVEFVAVHADVPLHAALRFGEGAGDAVALATPSRGGRIEPWRWLLVLTTLVIAAEAVVYARRRDADDMMHVQRRSARRQQVVATVSRVAIVGVLALAWFAAPLPERARLPVVALVVDDPGRYVGETRETLARIHATRALPGWDAGAVRGIVSIASHSVVASDGAASGAGPADRAAALDVETALRTAAGMLDDGGRIVVASDGLQSVGDLASAVPELLRRGIAVDVLPVGGLPLDEVWLERVRAPATVFTGSEFELVAIIGSEARVAAEVTLLRDGDVVGRHDVALVAGLNRFSLPLVEDVEGRHRYEFVVDAPTDAILANNREGIVVDVRSPLRVAVVTTDGVLAERFAGALEAQGIEGVPLHPDEAPTSAAAVVDAIAWWEEAAGWNDYEAVVLLGVAAIDLSWPQQVSLASYVREYGGGLIVIGGETTFGPGGYYLTALDELLPVSAEIPHERPVAAISFVLDRSGSMQAQVGQTGLNRLEVTKVATVSAIDMLDEGSLVGIVVFDGFAHEVMPVGDVSLSAAIGALTDLEPGGGTNIYAGLALGVDQLTALDEGWTRHIVLMTDGLGQGGIDYEPILEEILQAGITVSTAAIGQGADVWLLEEIALRGGGTSYATEDFQAFPSIMAQEILMLTEEPVRRLSFTPTWGDGGDAAFLRGVRDPPALGGFVMTSSKPGADIHWVGPEEAPILASWRYGVGRVIAFTSDAVGPWSEQWLTMSDFPAFWAQAVRWSSIDVPGPGLHVEAKPVGDEIVVVVTVVPHESLDMLGSAFVAEISPLAGDAGARPTASVRLQETAPHRYEGRLVAEGVGDFEVTVWSPRERLVTAFATEPAFEPVSLLVHKGYEARYRFDPSARSELVALAQLTGGGVLTSAASAGPSVVRQWVWTPAVLPWGLLATFLFLLDLARRYGIARFAVRSVAKPRRREAASAGARVAPR